MHRQMDSNAAEKWKEFRKTGLLWWINMVLHTFGWAIVVEVASKDDGDYRQGDVISVYPDRVPYRGFHDDVNTDGYTRVSRYMADTGKELWEEAKGE